MRWCFILYIGCIDKLNEGFNSWFILQHSTRFNGEYKPFITTIKYEVPIGEKITYPTQYPFKDSKIIGSTPDEIIEKYGEPIIDYRRTDYTKSSTQIAYPIIENRH